MDNKKFDFEKVQEATKMLLEAFGEDINRPGLKDTPRRVAGYWQELLEGQEYTNKEIADMFKKDFQVSDDPLVVVDMEDIYSHCEHHLALMFNGVAYIAYIPAYYNGHNADDGYRVIGLSKIYRIVDMCSKRLQLQEKLASDIVECIELATGSDKVYVNLSMNHGCVSARGIKSRGKTNVTKMSTALKQDLEARKEIENKVLQMKLDKK